MNRKELIYPLDDIIIQKCKDGINVNSHKGNSWMIPEQTPFSFLILKLTEEYSELVLALKDDDTSMIEKESADVINIVSMIMRRYRI